MTSNIMEKLEHIQFIIQMEAGALSLIIASKRGLNIPQIRKTQATLRTAVALLDDIIIDHVTKR